MLFALTPAEMRAADDFAINALGIPPAILMEDAASAAFEVMKVEVAKNVASKRPKIVFLCGSGNNGGDGFVLARRFSHCADVRVFWIGSLDKMSAETRINYSLLASHAIPTLHLTSEESLANIDDRLFRETDCIVDALVGNGGSEYLRGLTAILLKQISTFFADGASLSKAQVRPFRIAIDIPSGLNAETGKAHEHCFRADLTVTMAAHKTGLLLNDASEVCGKIVVVPIGIPSDYIAKQAMVRVLGNEDLPVILPKRPRRAMKHDFGTVAVIGGTHGMSGAPALAANASISAGAGLVRLYAPSLHYALKPEIMTHLLPSDESGAIAGVAEQTLKEIAEKNTAFVIGPGLGTSPQTIGTVRDLLRLIPPEKPIVIDADGLRAVKLETSEKPDYMPLRRNIVLTPHRGEFARLTGCDYASIPENAQRIAPEWAQKLGCTILLKNVPTIISNGELSYWNTSGNAGMATAGSGDVLAGMIGALLAQGFSKGNRDSDDGLQTLNLCALAAYLHGKAGDVYAARYSPQSLTASGLVDMLAEVFDH